MQKLSLTDATFLFTESKETPNHVAGLTIVELPENYEGSFFDAYVEMLKSRIDEVPMMKWKLANAALDLDYPYWVEADDIEWDYHVRSTALARPGTDKQLWDKISRLHTQLLDRSRPLWEHYVIEGLEGNRVAIYSKVHHSAVDGQTGQQMQKVLFDAAPTPRGPLSVEQLKQLNMYRHTGKKAPSFTSQLAEQAKKSLLKRPALLDAPKYLNAAKLAFKKRGDLKNMMPTLAPKTIFNVPISDKRAFATGSVPLSAMKAVKNETGTTLNDVTVAICGGALRRYLDAKRALPAEGLMCGAPVALPQKGNSSNNVSMMVMPYGTEIEDPVERLHFVHDGAVKAKAAVAASLELTDVMPEVELPAPIAKRLTSAFFSPAVAGMIPAPMNVVMSNVPGSPVPFYVAGAKVVANYPVSIAQHGQAMNITSVSYEDRMDIGIISCARVMHAPEQLVALIEDEFATLYEQVMGEKLETETPDAAETAFTAHKGGQSQQLAAAVDQSIGQAQVA